MNAAPGRGDVVGVIGTDGRTDALADRCLASPGGSAVTALTELANPGLIARCGRDRVTIVDDLCDVPAVTRWAQEVEPSLVIVGPEAPLAAGVVDALDARGVPCFGPPQRLARIESSKTWARQLVDAYDIPGNPAYRSFETTDGLEAHLRAQAEFVVKPDGLTGGKGVRLYPEHFESLDEAVRYARDCVEGGGRVLVEERLEGEELSLMTITDGESAVHCPAVQDHKRADEGDTGPNTGGMGSYSCADLSLPFLDAADVEAARRINEAVIDAIARATGAPYRGVLYGGFMATADGVRLIEYNCRFGDPEALNVLPILDGDFVEIARATATGRLGELTVHFQPKATVCKYVVPVGYPGAASKGDPIDVPADLLDDPDVRLYWAAAELTDAGPALTGSRALGVVGIGNDLAAAEAAAERAASSIGGAVRHRRDIGTAALVARRIEHLRELRGRS